MQNKLILNLEKLHTTTLGVERIKRNLQLDTDNVVAWCKQAEFYRVRDNQAKQN